MARPCTDVVILIPGILGSVLERNGREVWSPSGGAIVRAMLTLASSVKDLALARDEMDVDDLGDGVIASRLIPDTHLIPGFWKIDGYSKVARFLRRRLQLLPGENFFEFPYDWRRSNRVAARRLAGLTRVWLDAWRSAHNPKAKLILVAHSMGGLVARYFLEKLDGWRDTRLLITFGTPYAGSLDALEFLVNGFRKGIGPLTLLDLTDLLRSLSSVYEVLPTFPCVGWNEKQLSKVSEFRTLPFIDWTRLEKAEVFHEEIKQGVEAHRTDPEYTHAGYAINPIVGVYQETSQSAVFVNGRVRTLPTYWDDESGEAVDHSGDGRVPRISAVPHEHSLMSGWMATACHAALQNADDVLEQVFFTITGAQIEGVVMRSVTELAGVGLKVTDLFSTDEPIAASIRCEDRSRELEIALEAAEGKQVIESKVVRFGDDEWTSVEFPPQQAGLYRLRVSGAGAQTVEDVFLTLEP